MHPSLTAAPGPRVLLAAADLWSPGTHPTSGALAPATALPLALSGSSLAYARDPGNAPRLQLGRTVPGGDRSGLWLRNAAAGLCVLAAAAAAVSFTAQYRMVDATRHLPAIAALEAAIPDAAALVFACLGIALALHGRRALRARALNLAAVGTSVFMNAIAAAPGWRNLAIWAMPPIAYALASDTLIGVVRAWTLARQHHLTTALAADAATPLAVVGGLILWLLRLALAPGLHRVRVPRLGPGRMPGRPRPPRPRPAPATADGPAEGDQDRPVPFFGRPNGTAHLPPSPLIASPRSAPPWLPRSA